MSGDLFDYFSELAVKIKSAELDINILVAEVEKKAEKAEKEKKEKKDKQEKDEKKGDKRIISTTTIEPMTRMRSSVNEVKTAQKNPEIQFAVDRINDAFK